MLRLNRPEKLNAFTYDTLREIRAAIDACAADPRVVGIVITGNGRGFCAGLDAATLAAVTSAPAAPRTESDALPGIFSYLLEVPKPVIAAINGVAAGGGLILALMSDLRIASRDASFTTVFLKRGLIAEHGSSWLLPRLVGTGRALDLLWMSDRIDADTALRVGLVESVVDADALLDTAMNYIRRSRGDVVACRGRGNQTLDLSPSRHRLRRSAARSRREPMEIRLCAGRPRRRGGAARKTGPEIHTTG